jgi:hypothetical protein
MRMKVDDDVCGGISKLTVATSAQVFRSKLRGVDSENRRISHNNPAIVDGVVDRPLSMQWLTLRGTVES